MTDTSSDADVSRCPSCDSEVGEDAVLCISCGYHLQKGAHLEVDSRRERRHWLGFITSQNAVVLFSGAGALLGVSLAVVLGSMYGTGMAFEMGIYIFVGLVLGTVIGGGIGFVVSSRLPDASAEGASEQLMGGLFTLIGGFMVCGIGIVSFGVLNDAESRGGPVTLPKIAIAVYELLGKWGVLAGMVGVGMVLIVLGVRAMMPGKGD